MDFVQCFKFLAGRLREEIIVTSAGSCTRKGLNFRRCR
jgi:hypothetical protein